MARKFSPHRNMKTTRLSLLLAVAALSGATLHAAPMTWGAPQQITGDADVNTTGALFGAYNFGGATTTVNGVTFGEFGTGSPSITEGNFTLSLAPGDGNVGFNNTSSATAPFSNLTASYRALLGTAAERGDRTMTLSIAGLTIGESYLFQTWVNDSRDFNGNVFTVDLNRDGNGVGEVTLAPGQGLEGSLGRYVTGTFTANATSQQVTYFGSEVGVVNAAQLRRVSPPVVPEPGTALFGLALLGTAGFSRRRSVAR